MFLLRLPRATINSQLFECSGQATELVIAVPLNEQVANTARVDGRSLRGKFADGPFSARLEQRRDIEASR